MEVHIGPVPSRSARAWVAFATEILTSDEAPAMTPVDTAAVEEFLGYLAIWDAHAEANPDTFVWVGTIDPERLEYLAHSFARIVDHLWTVAMSQQQVRSPAEGEEFYQALVLSIIDTLQQHGDSAGEFSEQLRDSWPGLRRD